MDPSEPIRRRDASRARRVCRRAPRRRMGSLGSITPYQRCDELAPKPAGGTRRSRRHCWSSLFRSREGISSLQRIAYFDAPHWLASRSVQPGRRHDPRLDAAGRSEEGESSRDCGRDSAPDSGSLYSKESANAKFLEAEAGRQERLIAQLEADPETAAWVEHGALWTNYRALQFFDTLALYFNLDAPEQRGTTEFPKVPRKAS